MRASWLCPKTNSVDGVDMPPSQAQSSCLCPWHHMHLHTLDSVCACVSTFWCTWSYTHAGRQSGRQAFYGHMLTCIFMHAVVFACMYTCLQTSMHACMRWPTASYLIRLLLWILLHSIGSCPRQNEPTDNKGQHTVICYEIYCQLMHHNVYMLMSCTGHACACMILWTHI